ncbi:MAG: hypothetical protein ACRYGK_02520, partial [Janthinobacterium lividum]
MQVFSPMAPGKPRPRLDRSATDWVSQPGSAVLQALPQMHVRDLSCSNAQVLMLLCDSIDSAQRTGLWDRDAQEARQGRHGSLLARFNRAEFDTGEPGCLPALVRFSRVLRSLYPVAADEQAGLALAGQQDDYRLACDKLYALVRSIVDDPRLWSIEQVHALCDALMDMVPAHGEGPPELKLQAQQTLQRAVAEVDRRPPTEVYAEPQALPEPQPDRPFDAAPHAEAEARCSSKTEPRRQKKRDAALLAEVDSAPHPKVAPKPESAIQARPEADNKRLLPPQPKSSVQPVEKANTEPAALPKPQAVRPANPRVTIRRQWFEALGNRANPRHATLDAWLRDDPGLLEARDAGATRKAGLWHAIANGKTGVVSWMTQQPALATYLFADPQCGALADILSCFDIDNENPRLDALNVLLSYLRKQGEPGRQLLATINSAQVVDAPATRALLQRLKLLTPVTSAAPTIVKANRLGAAALRLQGRKQRLAQAGEQTRIREQAELLAKKVYRSVKRQNVNELIDACGSGDILKAFNLLEAGDDLNGTDALGRNALMHAAMQGHTVLFLPIMLGQINLNAVCRHGLTAIDYARIHSPDTRKAMVVALDQIITSHLFQIGPLQTAKVNLKPIASMPPSVPPARMASSYSDEELRRCAGASAADLDFFLSLRRALAQCADPAARLAQPDALGVTPLLRLVLTGAPLLVRAV